MHWIWVREKQKNETKNDKNDVHDNNGSGEMKQLNTSNKKLIKEKQFELKQKENAIDWIFSRELRAFERQTPFLFKKWVLQQQYSIFASITAYFQASTNGGSLSAANVIK